MKNWKYHHLGNKFPFPIRFLVKHRDKSPEVQKEFLKVDYFRCNLMVDYYLDKEGNYEYEIRLHTNRAEEMLKDKPEWLI